VALMRRRFEKFLPIILIALVVQILAPIGATWAAAIAIGDPLSAAPICHGSWGGEGPTHGDPNGRAHDGACSLCCAAQAAASLDTPKAVAIAVPYRFAARVFWRAAANELLPARTGSNSQARAPPLAI
jgi:hypothetical protein